MDFQYPQISVVTNSLTLLKSICHPQTHIRSTFAVICGKSFESRMFPAEVKTRRCLASCFSARTVHRCLCGLFGAPFFFFVFFCISVLFGDFDA